MLVCMNNLSSSSVFSFHSRLLSFLSINRLIFYHFLTKWTDFSLLVMTCFRNVNHLFFLSDYLCYYKLWETLHKRYYSRQFYLLYEDSRLTISLWVAIWDRFLTVLLAPCWRSIVSIFSNFSAQFAFSGNWNPDLFL